MTDDSPSADEEIMRQARELATRAARRAAETDPPYHPHPRGLRNPVDEFQRHGPTDPRREPVALVLAGGGARGAYEAGVARFLAESGTPVTAVSGASIGALNGAILAAAPTLELGAKRLVEAWTYSGGRSLFEPGFLDELVRRFVDLDDLRAGTPLLVSVFPSVEPSLGGVEWLFRGRRGDGPDRALFHPRFGFLVDLVRAKVLGAKAEVRMNTLPSHQVHDMLLASAAIPVVFPPRRIDGRTLRDGGIADNLPVGALAQLADVTRVVVVHLEPYPLFNPDDFPDLQLIEIMPSRPLATAGPLGWFSGLTDLSPERIADLYELGHSDARTQLGRVWEHEGIARVAEFTHGFRHDAVTELNEPR